MGDIRFRRLALHEVCIPFRFRFKHALAERSEARNLILILETECGHTGYGEVLPREYLTGETIQSAWDDITSRWWPAVSALTVPRGDGSGIATIMKTLAPLYAQADADRKTASYAGIDVAAVDAWARASGIAGRGFFTHVPAPAEIATTAPLGGASGKKTRRLAQLCQCLGFREYKIKTGQADDRERIQAVREIVGTEADVRIDANAAWSVEDAIQMARELKQLGVSSIEQPIPAGDAAALARVQREGGVSVMADESLCTRADAEQLLAADAARIWNVRLAKVGGFSGMIALGDLAQAKKIDLHLGVLVGETGLLAAAQRACLGLATFRHVEFGFPRLLLKHDLFAGTPDGYRGIGSRLSNRPGLGVTLNEKQLRRYSVRSEVLR